MTTIEFQGRQFHVTATDGFHVVKYCRHVGGRQIIGTAASRHFDRLHGLLLVQSRCMGGEHQLYPLKDL